MNMYFITSNRNKFDEAAALLRGVRLRMKSLELREIQSISVRDVVKEKAMEAYRVVGMPLLVEDTGLYIESLNGFPGALVKWVLESIGREGVCRITGRNRSAYAETCICYTDGKTVKVFSGRAYGKIAVKPRGRSGFGWDPIFVPEGHKTTFAEMRMEEKNRISHRSRAFHSFRRYASSLRD